jgi:hypothetical protein
MRAKIRPKTEVGTVQYLVSHTTFQTKLARVVPTCQQDVETQRNRNMTKIGILFLLWKPVFCIRIRIRIHRVHVFLSLPDPDPLVRGMNPDPALDPDTDPSISKQI